MKTADKQRSQVIAFRVTPEEHDALSRAAASHGVTLTEYVRHVALNRRLKTKAIFETDPALISAINRNGANLNQIARSLNMNQGFRPAELDALLAELRALVNRLV